MSSGSPLYTPKPEIYRALVEHYGEFNVVVTEEKWLEGRGFGRGGDHVFVALKPHRDIGLWIENMVAEAYKGKLFVCFLPAATNRMWFYPVWDYARSILFLQGDVAAFPACIAIFAPPIIEPLPGLAEKLIGYEARR